MGNDLKNKAVSGIKWTSIYTALSGVSGVLSKFVFAMILAPGEYAYIAVLSLFTGLSNQITSMGLGEAILQRDKISHNELSSIYIFEVIVTFLVTILLIVFAPIIENYYGYGDLIELLFFTSLTIFFSGISNIFRIYLQKHLLFKWVTIANMIKLAANTLVTIVLMLNIGIYGYVYGYLLGAVLYLILVAFYAFTKTDLRLKLHFKLSEIIPMVKYGFFISAKQLFTFFASRIDEIIIGGFLSSEALGIYYFAKDLINRPQSLITQSFAQVVLPVFSKLKDEFGRLSNVYAKSSRYIALFAVPIFMGIAVTAELYVPLLFGEEWVASIVPIQIFSITGILLVLTANFSTSLLYALNQPNKVLYIEIITNVVYFAILFLTSRFGMYYILVTYVLYIGMKTLSLQILVSKNLHYSMYDYLKGLSTVFILSIMMTIAVKLSIEFLVFTNLWLTLIISIIIGVIVYLILIFKFERETVEGIIALVK